MKSFDPANLLAAVAGIFVIAPIAHGDLVGTYSVGTGANTSYLQFEFANTNAYLYEVRYDGSIRGNDLLAIVAAAQPGFFSYQVVSFSFGDALFGVSIGTDSNEGFGTPPAYLDYWHYWIRDSESSAWTSSMIGFADRIVANGSWDGWVFDSESAPASVPAPAAGAMLAAAAVLVGRRRR